MENNIIIDELHYGNGKFEFIDNESNRLFLISVHKAINNCELWNWLRIYEPEPNKGFTWSEEYKLTQMKYGNPQ